MAIRYILLANSHFDLENSAFFKQLSAISKGSEGKFVNYDDEDDVITLLLNGLIKSAGDDQLVFCFMYRAGDPKQRCSKSSVNQLWVELKAQNPNNKFVVFADSVPLTEENPVVDILSVYPYFMLADGILFAKEMDSQNFTNEIVSAPRPNPLAIERLPGIKNLYELRALESILNQSPAEVVITDVDMNFWYQEAEIKQAISGELAANNLKVFQPTTEGLVLNADDNVYINADQTFTVCSELAIGQSEIAANLDLSIFRAALQQIMKLTVAASHHTILFPINWIAKRHFCIGVLTVYVDRSNTEQPVLVSSDMKLTVLDTLYDGACLSAVQASLEPLITEFCQQGVKPELEANKYKITPQPDTNACGVLTADKIANFVIFGRISKSTDPLTRAEVAAIRRKHQPYIKPIQQSSSRKNLDSTPAKKIDISVLFESFNSYLQKLTAKEIAEFKAKALAFLSCELKSLKSNADERRIDVIAVLDAKAAAAKDKAQTVLKDFGEDYAFALTNFSLDVAMKNLKKYSDLLKEWFDKEEKEPALRTEEYGHFLDAIFKPNRDSDDDLEWASKDTDGRLNLVAVLERLFDLHLVTALTLEIPTAANDKTAAMIDYMQDADSLLKVKIGAVAYRYSGTINSVGLAHGLGEEVAPEFGYFYQGNFVNNRKAGDGIERHRLGNTNQFMEFAGTRDDVTGEYRTGSIKCFLGEEATTSGHRLMLRARLQNGAIEGIATASIVATPDFKDVMHFNFEVVAGKITAIPSAHFNIREDILASLVSAVGNSIDDLYLSLNPNFEFYINRLRDSKLVKQQDVPVPPAQGFYPLRTALDVARAKDLRIIIPAQPSVDEQDLQLPSPTSSVSAVSVKTVNSAASGFAKGLKHE